MASYFAIAGVVAGIAVTLIPAPSTGTPVIQLESSLHDETLRLEPVVEGLEFPTSMRFLDENNLLVLQKNDGEVRLVSDGILLENPVFEVDVANEAERGLLGIATWRGNSTDVFLYFTENMAGDLRNRVYKYVYDPQMMVLTDARLVLDLPAKPGPFHNGGKIDIGPDGRLYAVIGDTNDSWGMLDNMEEGRPPEDKSVVFRVDRETGEGVWDNPFYHDDNEKMKRYFAYGIRNSFGIDFDPVSGSLWVTENGEDEYDEINLVSPGFNSGWRKLMGPMERSIVAESDLVSFEGAHYQDPAFSWRDSVGVTDIEFFNSGKLGKKYENNIFVGDINNGNLYFFGVNEERNGLVLEGSLSDLVADNSSEMAAVTLGVIRGGISDIETGPDGNLYVLSFLEGKIYKITRD